MMCRQSTPGMKHQNVMFGGTFDRLHQGHFQMFETAIKNVAANGTIYVGLTTDELLATKTFKDKIYPYSKRQLQLETEMNKLKLSFNVEFKLAIQPICTKEGPATEAWYMGALVVSEESLKNGEVINQVRKQKGLPDLNLVVIPLVTDSSGGKLSSSDLRKVE